MSLIPLWDQKWMFRAFINDIFCFAERTLWESKILKFLFISKVCHSNLFKKIYAEFFMVSEISEWRKWNRFLEKQEKDFETVQIKSFSC